MSTPVPEPPSAPPSEPAPPASDSTSVAYVAKTHLALFFVQLAFASQAVESKVAMLPRSEGGLGISPEAIALMRMVFAALVFQVIFRAKKLPMPSWQDLGRVFGLSLVGITINQMLFLAGLKRTTPFVAALLSVTIPLASAALSALFRKERFTLATGVGLLLGGSGVVILAGWGSLDRGAVLVAVNSVCYATYVVLSRDTVRKLGAITLMTWLFAFGALSYFPFGIGAFVRDYAHPSPLALLFGVYVVVVPTVLAYLANAWALGRSGPSLVTAYIYLQPAIAAILAWFQLGTHIPERAILATPLIALGVFVVSMRFRARARA